MATMTRKNTRKGWSMVPSQAYQAFHRAAAAKPMIPLMSTSICSNAARPTSLWPGSIAAPAKSIGNLLIQLRHPNPRPRRKPALAMTVSCEVTKSTLLQHGTATQQRREARAVIPMMILTTMPANGVNLDDPQPAASLANDYMLPVHQAADHHRMTSKMRVTHGLRQRRFQEWSLEDATLKRVFIGGQALFQIQFSWNSRLNDHSVADVGSRVGVRTSTPRRSRRASRRAIGHAFTPEEDNLLIGLKESQDRLPWSEIHKRFSSIVPGQRSQGSLQVHYCKLRGRKKTESPVMLPQEDQPTGRPQRSSSHIHYPHEDDSDDLDESDISTEDDDCFPAERVLARAESGDFLVLWPDSTTTWEPRSHFQKPEAA